MNLRSRFIIHKSDIKANKDKCGTSRYFSGKCKNCNNIFQFLSGQIVEQVYGNAKDLIKSRGKVLGKLNVYKSIWKCQLRFA